MKLNIFHTCVLAAAIAAPGSGTLRAENEIHIIPFETTAGVTSEDGQCFTVTMTNDDDLIWAFQLDFLLPEGVTLDDTPGLSPFELNRDRYPGTGRGNNFTYYHGIAYNRLKDGWYRVVVSPNDANRIKEHSGEVLSVYYLTDPDMKPGLYPILVRKVVMVVTGDFAYYNEPSVSYLSIGTSPLSTDAEVDLSCLEGALTSDVIAKMAEHAAANPGLTGLNMPGITRVNKALGLANPNTMQYLGAETQVLEPESNQVIGGVCHDFVLDDGHPFGASGDFTAENVTLRRGAASGEYSTGYLPFTLSADAVKSAFGDRAKVYTFEELTEDKLIYAKEAETIEAHTPFLLSAPDAGESVSFTFSNVEVKSTPAESRAVSMAKGSLGPVDPEGMYELADNLKFKPMTDKGAGFRTYFDLSSLADPSASGITFQSTSGLDNVTVPAEEGPVDIYGTDGRWHGKALNRRTAIEALPAGVYVIGGTKTLVK